MVNSKDNRKRKFRVIGFLVLQVLLIGGIGYFYRDFDTTTQSSAYSSNRSLYNEIPRSGIKRMSKESFSFKIKSNNTTSHKWVGADESQVFWKQLTHEQGKESWTIKVGKGGQLYSIQTQELGELIPEQRADHGQWIDEVFQHVIPSKIKRESGRNTIVDGDIHQAGYYIVSDIFPYKKVLQKSVYSPVFSAIMPELMGDPKSFSYITWPQHAHLPRKYKDNGMLMHQQLRDLGNGVIEITLVIDKWLGTETFSLNLPWATFRTASVPTQVISTASGGYAFISPQRAGEDKRFTFGTGQVGSWYALTKAPSLNSYGIGIVFQKEKLGIEGDGGYLRLIAFPNDEIPRTVTTNKRDITLKAGDSYFFRYYVILGKLSKIHEYGNQLKNSAQMGKINTSLQREGNVLICKGSDSQPLRRGCLENEQDRYFVLHRYFAENSYPLFLIQDNKNEKFYVTDDPYVLSIDLSDNRTVYSEFLGWARQDAKDLNKSEYVELSKVLPDKYIKTSRPLYVRR